MQKIIGAGQLITDTWHAFTKTWDVTVRYSAWFALVAILTTLPILLPENMAPFGFIAYLAGIVLAIWASINLYLVVFALERKEKVTDNTTKDVWTYAVPLILTGLLVGLATLGGFILLILPGIYLAIRLGFAQLAVIDKKMQPTQAFKNSWELTKGRFWPVLGRQLAAGLVYGILFLVVIMVATLIVNALAGIDGPGVNRMGTVNLAAAGADTVIHGLAQAAFMPLFYFLQIKLYNSLKATK
ncbi:hypothetical protein GF380_03275 [Candidatus Uhrbacteria bacterium]|nr:hypothetical protein [Candidatus Uhrbacteria bacterium]